MAQDILVLPARREAHRTWPAVIWHWARRYPPGAFGLTLVVILLLLAVGADVVATFDPRDASARAHLEPNSTHLLGTDGVGKDIFSLMLHGARISLAVAIAAVLLGVTGGALFGLLSGYSGGPLDLLGQRIVDALVAFPTIIKALVLMAILGPSPTNVVIALGIAYIPTSVRIIRSVVLRERERMYVDAARASGARSSRIMLLHVLPNSVPPYLVLVSVSIGQAIVAEASLSFLGAGVGPDVPSWGVMLGVAAQSYFDNVYTLALAPGLAITLAVLGFNLLGDALRDALDPRLRRG